MKALASIFFNSDYVEYLYSFETIVVFFQTTEYDVILSYFEMMSDAWRKDEGAGAVMSGPDLQTMCYNSLPLTVQFAVDLPGQPAVTAVLQCSLWEEEHENWLSDPFNSITGSFNNMEIKMLEILVMYNSEQTWPFSFCIIPSYTQ